MLAKTCETSGWRASPQARCTFLHYAALFLELCTHRAGELEILRDLPDDRRIGVGVVNQKLDTIETEREIVAKAKRAIHLFGKDRVLLTPDCGFATFADNPVSSAAIAEQKLRAIVQARGTLLHRAASSFHPLPNPLLHPMEERVKSRSLVQPWLLQNSA